MRYTPRPDCQIPILAEIYEQHLPPEPGRFVEIGAYDGLAYSNTFMLAEAGWQGLCVEPQPKYAADCAANHQGHNIRVEQVAISDFEGTADLYLIGECSSIVWDQNAVNWGGDRERKIQVPVTTLDSLLKRLNWEPKFDLLVIDVEQNELKVLAKFTLLYWLPKLVIIETHEKDNAEIRNWKAAPITEYFCERGGYAKIHADSINSIFVR